MLAYLVTWFAQTSIQLVRIFKFTNYHFGLSSYFLLNYLQSNVVENPLEKSIIWYFYGHIQDFDFIWANLHLVSFFAFTSLPNMLLCRFFWLFLWHTIHWRCSWWLHFLTCLYRSKHPVQHAYQGLTILSWLLRHLKDFKIIAFQQTLDVRNWESIRVFKVKFEYVQCLL